jgi:hypothetical protein
MMKPRLNKGIGGDAIDESHGLCSPLYRARPRRYGIGLGIPFAKIGVGVGNGCGLHTCTYTAPLSCAFVFPATRRRLLIGLAVLSGSRQTYTSCTVTVLRHGCLLSPHPMPVMFPATSRLIRARVNWSPLILFIDFICSEQVWQIFPAAIMGSPMGVSARRNTPRSLKSTPIFSIKSEAGSQMQIKVHSNKSNRPATPLILVCNSTF